MARLLRDQDYLKVIQEDNLLQIIESNQQVKLDMEQAAQAEMISYLAQRYITAEVFSNTGVFSISVVYSAKNLVYLNASAFSATATYLTGELVLQAGKIYSSIAGGAPGAFDASDWNLLGLQYDWFNVSLPAAEYSTTTSYAIGDAVWYANKVYTCVTACINILPIVSTFWGTGTVYTVTGILPTDNTKWAVGDTRNQQIVLHLLDITLYHLHSRINPRNVPDLRKERYDGNGPTQSGGAIGWLKRVASGDVTADLPNISPQQGMSIRYGNANGMNSDGTFTISKNTLW